MGGLVEKQLEMAIDALNNGQSDPAEHVVSNDYKVNAYDVDIDERCTKILALRKPSASDLRLVLAVIKMTADLERIGDEAEKIGLLASRLAVQERPASRYREIRHLGDQVGDLLCRTFAVDRFAYAQGHFWEARQPNAVGNDILAQPVGEIAGTDFHGMHFRVTYTGWLIPVVNGKGFGFLTEIARLMGLRRPGASAQCGPAAA